MAGQMAVAVLFSIYCIEAGAFFLIAPWTRFWLHSPLLHSMPWMAILIDNPFFRGLISGFGVLHLLIGIREFATFWESRRSGDGT